LQEPITGIVRAVQSVLRVLAYSLLLASVVSGAAARPPALFFEWHAPASCPDQAWVLGEVGRVRGHVDVLPSAEGADVVATAAVSYLGTRWTVRVDTRSAPGGGTRSIDAETCWRAAQAAATVLSLALAPFAPPPPLTTAPAPTTAEPALEVSAPLAPPPRTPWRFGLGLYGTSRVGILPQVVLGGALGVSLARGGWKVEAQFDTPAFQTATVQNSMAGGNLSLPFAGSLRGCRAITGEETAELAVCLEASLGIIHGEGIHVDMPMDGEYPWFATSAIATLRLHLWGPIGARIDAGGGVSWTRPQFTLKLPQGEALVYQVPWFNARAIAGLDLEL
jgi:hypothetical protein